MGTAAAACALAGAGTVRAHAATDHRLWVSTFKADVTPALGTPIYPSFEPLAVIEHPLFAKGVVLESNGQRYVLCALDWCLLRNSSHAFWRETIAAGAGVPTSHVALQTVHQHTAPNFDADAAAVLENLPNVPPQPTIASMHDPAKGVAEAVKASLPNVQPVDAIGLGMGRVRNVASNRRVAIGDGKVGFRASSCRDETMRALPEGLIDPFLKTITFRSGDRPIARMHYYATHPQSFYGDPRATYDFVGIARERFEEEEGVFQVYFTGCAGDIAAGKYNDGSKEARGPLVDNIYSGMKAAAETTTYAPAGTVEWRTTPVTFASRDDIVEEQCRADISDTSKTPNARMGGAKALSWRAREPKTFELSALRIGRACVAHLPGEPMIAYQLFAQESRPDLFVAVAGCGDAACGYICLEGSFAEGGYEPGASKVAPESEWVLKSAIRNLLDFA